MFKHVKNLFGKLKLLLFLNEDSQIHYPNCVCVHAHLRQRSWNPCDHTDQIWSCPCHPRDSAPLFTLELGTGRCHFWEIRNGGGSCGCSCVFFSLSGNPLSWLRWICIRMMWLIKDWCCIFFFFKGLWQVLYLLFTFLWISRGTMYTFLILMGGGIWGLV